MKKSFQCQYTVCKVGGCFLPIVIIPPSKYKTRIFLFTEIEGRARVVSSWAVISNCTYQKLEGRCQKLEDMF